MDAECADETSTGTQDLLLQQLATPYDDDPFAFAEPVVRDGSQPTRENGVASSPTRGSNPLALAWPQAELGLRDGPQKKGRPDPG